MNRRGSDKASLLQRQERILRYVLRGLTQREIAKLTHRDERTVQRDFAKIHASLAERVEAHQLYSLQRAYAEIGELWREGWVLFHRPQPEIMTKDGPVKIDDRHVKTLILRELLHMIHGRSRLAGFYSPKVLERIFMLETAQGRGIRIERLTFDEQLRLGVEELRHNEGLARSEGLLPPN